MHDPTCTDCGGTGITHQTERRCQCQPITAPAWDGRPLNPERDGWHWLLFGNGSRIACFWLAKAQGWCASDCPQQACDYLPEEAAEDHVGCESCLTPAEVAAKVAEEREACAAVVEFEAAHYSEWSAGELADGAAAAIRARGDAA